MSQLEAQPISYEDFVFEVRRYKRTSVLIACVRLGWKAWSLGEKSGLSLQDVHLGRAYAGMVAVIAAAQGTEDRSRLATDRDAARLCHQFLGIEERSIDETCGDLVPLLRKSEVFKFYEISDAALSAAKLQLFVGRMVRSQWDGRVAAYQGIVRAWELLRRMYRRRGRELLQRHTAALQIEPRDYILAGYSLFALLQAQKNPGFHDVAATTFEGGVDKVLNIDVEALKLVARRLSSTREELAAWHRNVMRLGPLDRKYAASPLVRRPMFQLDRSFPGTNGNGHEVICVSPDHVVWALQTSATEALIGTQREGEDLVSDLGEVLSEYIGDVLRHTCGIEAVTAVDDLPTKRGEQKADYIVRDGERAIVIEVKRSLWNAQERTTSRPEDVVRMWERLYKPCEQLSATIAKMKTLAQFQGITTYVPIACVDEAVFFQGRAFVSVCRSLGVFDRLGLPGLEILSVIELEKGLVSIGPTNLIDLVLEKQASGSRDGMLAQYAGEHSPPITKEHSDWSFLDEAESELTPPDPASQSGEAS